MHKAVGLTSLISLVICSEFGLDIENDNHHIFQGYSPQSSSFLNHEQLKIQKVPVQQLFPLQLNQSSPYYLKKADPYQQLYQYALSHEDIKQKLVAGQDISLDQQLSLWKFMVQHPYFQQQLIEQMTKRTQNKWLKMLGPSAQTRYLQIICDLDHKNGENPDNLEQIQNRLLDDYDIGHEYRKQKDRRCKHRKTSIITQTHKILADNYL